MPGTTWPNIPSGQMLSYDDVILAKDEGYLKFFDSPPVGYIGNELVSYANWQTFVSNGLYQELSNSQIVWKGVVETNF
jgi:hypothetical protein